MQEHLTSLLPTASVDLDFFGLLAFLGCCRPPGLPGVGGRGGGRAPELPLAVGGREGGRAAFPGEGRAGAEESELVRFLFFTFLGREVSLQSHHS